MSSPISNLMSEHWAEAVPPISNRFATDVDAALVQQVFDIAKGEGEPDIHHHGQANFDGNYTYNGSSKGQDRKSTVAVGSFPSNAFGLHDMHGNVWEWVADCWNKTYRGAPADGRAWNTGDCARRVLRGGSWLNTPRPMRAALRFRLTPGGRDFDVGFRIARTLF